MTDQEYTYLKERVLKLVNLDLNCYKTAQMRRRLDGFVAKVGGEDVSCYCHTLARDYSKLKELVDFIAINVSEFFRDTSLFNRLKTTVLPELLRKSSHLNIWSAACSCGQEAYSIAMILSEFGSGSRHRILASDIDDSALERARNGGPYPPLEVKNVGKAQMRFFNQNNEGFWVKNEIKEKVEFKRHNLLYDAFEKNFDLIVCRNVIIYFSDKVRDALYSKFNNSLKTNGVLFTGGSEVILCPDKMNFRILAPSFYLRTPEFAGAVAIS